MQKPCVICGPSGVGVRTLIKKLESKLSNKFKVAISHTTRKPRVNEKNGIDYYFINQNQFKIDISNNKFLEYVLYENEYYGTTIKSLNDIKNDNNNSICILQINVFGAEILQNNNNIKCNYLYITTSNGIKTLRKRLISRATESIKQIENRLITAKKEIEFFENNPNFFDCVIYNDRDIDETLNQLIEQLILWYPNLKIDETNGGNDEIKSNDYIDLKNMQKINRVSKRQSVDLFADFALKNNELFITQESLCKDIFLSNISPFKDNDNIILIIIEYTDISPKNRKHQWNYNEFNLILNKLSSVEHRWTIGNNINIYPNINLNTIGNIYFAYHETIMTGIIFYLCGTIRCPVFAKKYYNAEIENIETDWDKCWDIYFYMKCDSDCRGSVQFSRQWTNMLIFGIDNDAIRQASENGIWKLNTKQSNNFLIKTSAPSSICEDNDEIVDD